MRYKRILLVLAAAGQLGACVNYHPQSFTKGAESSIGLARITMRGGGPPSSFFHVHIARDSVIGFADHKRTRRFAFPLDDVQEIERGQVAIGRTVALFGTLAVLCGITFFAIALSSVS